MRVAAPGSPAPSSPSACSPGLGLAARPAQAAFPGRDGLIAYHPALITSQVPSYRFPGAPGPATGTIRSTIHSFEILTVRPDGSGQRPIAGPGAGDPGGSGPAFSPDGKRIAYSAFGALDTLGLGLMDADG